ncbi:AraC family transcriptional regulator [Pricia sp. S334]|uniref:AraC family transcriptional regulator n=1 Tax=Pricia mediterranea TaxID=3076079 RepID=A0ABU3L1E4_9FLAO|nr:AraC family transcriptional regulator [Pricia sp. S334]MDT7827430.1 AraC family transcriptional regulator [Pricia sp. S334]
MKTFYVSSLPLRDVISDVAREFGTDVTESCGIFEVKIPELFGCGTITGTDFDDGLGLIRYDCTFKEDVIFEYSLDKVHPVKFLFCLEGDISHKFMNESDWHEIPKYKNAIVASSAYHGHSVRFRAGQRTLYNSLELERRKFQGKISCEPHAIAKSWRDMLNDVTAKKTFYHDGFYSLKLSGLFEEWNLYDRTDFLMKLYLEGLAYKILTLQITQFQDDIKSEGKKTLLRKSELKQLMKAVEIIEDSLEDLPTINDLASEVGLNANKLQQGFREMYDKTVNKYIREKRLETARTLLLNTDDTLSAIAARVGYKSQSYLSKMFRENYGLLPSEFRRDKEQRKFRPDEGLNLKEPYNT